MKVNITSNQYNNLIISEAENVAYNRNNANEPNLKAIWDAIDRKQKILQDEVFGELSEKIYDITGHHSHILRFPGGSSNRISKHYNEGIMTRITEKLIKDNYYYFDWNIDSGDASGTLPKEKI